MTTMYGVFDKEECLLKKPLFNEECVDFKGDINE